MSRLRYSPPDCVAQRQLCGSLSCKLKREGAFVQHIRLKKITNKRFSWVAGESPTITELVCKRTVVTAEYEEMLLKYDFTTTSARKVASQFDPERQKIITREQIYRVLNCPGNYMPKMSVPRDISILSSDMGPYLQYFVIHMARKIMKYLPDMKEVVSRIKMRLDSLYGPLWHVFIVRGQYWAYYSHDTRTGLVFKKDDLIYLMYRSPTAE